MKLENIVRHIIEEAKQLTGDSLVAKNIRDILKKKFPKTKFSVRKSNGGSSINISYKNGPPEPLINEIARNHESIDRDDNGEILAGGNTFVFVNRDVDRDKQEAIRKVVEKVLNKIGNIGDMSINEKENIIRRNVRFVLITSDLDKKITVVEKKGSGSMVQLVHGNMFKDKEIQRLIRTGMIS